MQAPSSRSPLKVLLLLILTCGLYYFYWIYVTARDIQRLSGESDIPPIVELILTILTGGLYLFYWDWKTAKQTARLQERYGATVVNDNAVLYLILNILGAGPIAGLGILVPLIQQHNLNLVYERIRSGQTNAFAV